MIDERLKTRVQGEGRARAWSASRSSRRNARRVGRAAAAARARSRPAGHERPAADRSRQRDGPVQPDRPGRHAEPPPHLHRAGPPSAADEAACARKILSTLARRAYRRPVTDADMAPMMAHLRGGPEEGQRSTPASSRACGWSSPTRSSCSAPRRRRRQARPRSATSSWRRGCRSSSGARIPDDELLTLAAQGRLQPAGGARTRRCKRMLEGPEVARAGRQLRQPVADAAQPEGPHPDAGRLPELRQRAAPGVPHARPSCSSRASCARTAACSTCSTPTTRSSTSGWRATTASRTSTAATSAASR